MTPTSTPFRVHAFDPASYKVLSIVALICIDVCRSAVAASPPPSAYPRTADNLALGLGRIRWGMTTTEVQLAYPDVNFTFGDGYSGSSGMPARLTVSQYRYGECTFGLTFSFRHDRLSVIDVRSETNGESLRACRREVRQDFARRYGPSDRTYPNWDGPVTNVAYDVPMFIAPLPPPGPPPPRPLHIGFADAQDISGAAAEARARDNECLSITAEFIGDAPSDGASVPFIVPSIRNLGCDYYPPVSFRLFERGKVIVEARILADGSVAEARLAEPNRSSRLNETALDLVRNRLVINPSFKDGKPIEATRQIAVTFTLTHYLRGIQ